VQHQMHFQWQHPPLRIADAAALAAIGHGDAKAIKGGSQAWEHRSDRGSRLGQTSNGPAMLA